MRPSNCLYFLDFTQSSKLNAAQLPASSSRPCPVLNHSDDDSSAFDFEEPLSPHSIHEQFMCRAIELGMMAYDQEEVPVGALIVHEGRIIGEGYNQRETLKDPTAHAEMLAITQAASARNSWRLLDCTLYVTLEPCPMCAGAIVQARIPTVIYGTTDPKGGACHTLYSITDDNRLNHRCQVLGGVMKADCHLMRQQFFADQRAKGKK